MTMDETATNDQSVEMDFDAIRLYPGAVMQIQSLSDASKSRHEVRLIGFIKDRSLLVTLPLQNNGQGMWMRTGQAYVIRGFNGTHAYAFTSKVIKARSSPFSYVHFSLPSIIECQLVRKLLRVNVALTANVALPNSTAASVNMLDLSASGSMVDSPTTLGEVGEKLQIGFSVNFEGNPVDINVTGIIRNSHQKEDGTGFRVGLGFENLSQHDSLILHYFINAIAH